MSRVAPRVRQMMVITAIVAIAGMLGGCGDAHPLYGPDSPRDGAGRPVDPIYGTPLPGVPLGNGSM
jgi:predicted small lipoprotein YifL